MGHVGVFIWQHWLFISPAEPTLKGGGSAGHVLGWCIACISAWMAGWLPVGWYFGRLADDSILTASLF